MHIAYVNYGSQSGVTGSVTRELAALGHTVTPLDPTDVFALRDKETRRPRPTVPVLTHLAASFLHHGRNFLDYRLVTDYAFRAHSRRVGEMLLKLRRTPDLVLQNGALFAPGEPPPFPYVMLLDNTCMLAQQQPAVPAAGLARHFEYGRDWLERERRAYAGARAIATFSEVVKQSLTGDYKIPARKIHVIGAGANIHPDVPVRRDDGQTLLFVGKDGWNRKGGPILLEAFTRLRRERPGLRLVLAGPTERIDLPEGAVNLGVVPLQKVEELLAEATVFVLPTLREPYGIAFLDAMMAETACVGTQVAAVPEILGETGLCVPPADAAALAAAIDRLLSDEKLRVSMARAGRVRALSKGLLWPQVAERLAKVMEDACVQVPTPPAHIEGGHNIAEG
jgi:glycosyltransferase involved in cell wall biosynthesis